MLVASVQSLLELAEGQPQQGLQVADKPVHVSLIGGLFDNVLVVIVAQATAQLLVVHRGLALALAPASRHLRRIDDLELPVFLVGPLDAGLALPVCQKFQQKLPQLDLGARAELHLRR